MSFPWAKVVSRALFSATASFGIGSVELDSKISILNNVKNQEQLNHAVYALREYSIVVILWTTAVAFAMYANYGIRGALTGIFANMLILTWIVSTYSKTFNKLVDMYNLQQPKLFNSQDKIIISGLLFLGFIFIVYKEK